jgi:glutathione S-transferase
MATVYHYDTSHCSRKVRLVVAELDIPHELVTVHITMCQNYAPNYVRLNPGMVVPTFVDIDGTVVLDSKVIIEYVVKNYTGKYNSVDLRPQGSEAEKTAAYWLGQMDTLDVQTISFGSGNYLPPIVADLREKKTLRLLSAYIARFSEKEPKLAELYRIRQKKVLGAFNRITSKEDGKAALDRLLSDLKQMDSLLADGRAWLCGNQFTLADVGWAPVFRRLDDIKYTEMVFEGLPNVQRYVHAVKARPAYKKAIDGFPPPTAQMRHKLRVIGNLAYDRFFGGKEAILLAGIVALAAFGLFYVKKT